MPKKRLILASSSPSRKALISTSLLPLLSSSNFIANQMLHIIPSSYDEVAGRDDGSMSPREYVAHTAKCKAMKVLKDQINKIGKDSEVDIVVIGADTIMILDDAEEADQKDRARIIGKQSTREEAKACLKLLSGRIHKCLTAQVIVQATLHSASQILNEHLIDIQPKVFETLVEFMPLTEDSIESYLDTNEWQGRAGAYAIQGIGASLVKEIKGNLTSVVGLNIPHLLQSLTQPPYRFNLKRAASS